MDYAQQEKPRYRNLDNDPFYFTHFLNMGRHNVFIILNDIYSTVYKENLNLDESNFGNFKEKVRKKSKNRPDEMVRVLSLLQQHFPFLGFYADEAESQGQYNVLDCFVKNYLNVLHTLRNQTAHYGHSKQELRVPGIQDLFRFAVREAQRRMTYSDEEIKHLLMKPYYQLWDENGLTEAGIIYFITLFLDKKNGYLFLSRLKGFKDRNRTSERYKSATLEAFTQFHCRVPYPKLESSDIALDMLNELNRCPGPLYHVLNKEDQEKFKAKVKGKEEDDELPDSILRRHEDRFPYFALRYFEKPGALEGIAFQLYLGRKYAQPAHRKELNGELRTHHLLKNMHGFGPLSFYKRESAFAYFGSEENEEAVESYTPAYRVVGNRIGLLLREVNRSSYRIPRANESPDAILSTHELGALFFYHFLYKKGWIGASPQTFIQDFLARFRRFLADVKEGKITPLASDSKIRKRKKHKQDELDELGRRNHELQTVLDAYGLKVHWLPDACREYLIGYAPSRDHFLMLDQFRKMRNDAESRVKRMEAFEAAEPDERGRSRKPLRVGELAQDLARDIVFLTPPQVAENGHRKKINNLEFDILQKMLAHFRLYKTELRTYFDVLKESDKRWHHPFLYKIIRYEYPRFETFSDFYVSYYRAKKRWISSEILKEKRNPENRKPYAVEWELTDAPKIAEKYGYIVKLHRKTKSAVEKEYRDQAVFLPTGLFREVIAGTLKKQGFSLKEGSTVAGCVKAYLNDATQGMYTLPHYYRAGKVLDGDEPLLRDAVKEYIGKNLGGADELRQKELKKLRRRIRNHESEILRQQCNDRILFLMVQELIPGFKEEGLDRLGFDCPDSLLDRDYEMHEFLERKNSSGHSVRKRITAKLPIKRYGEFRRFLKDSRLDNLIHYYPSDEEEIPLGTMESGRVLQKGEKYSCSNLTDELEVYDRERDALLELMYRVDQTLVDHFPGQIKPKEMGNGVSYYEHYDCLHFAKTSLRLSEEVDVLNEPDFKDLRNELMHNRIPYNSWIRQQIEWRTDEPIITKRIVDLVREKYNRLLECINVKIQPQ